MSKPIVVETTKATDDYPKGAELGFETETKATSTLGEGAFKVTRYQDGGAYEAPKASTRADSADKKD